MMAKNAGCFYPVSLLQVTKSITFAQGYVAWSNTIRFQKQCLIRSILEL